MRVYTGLFSVAVLSIALLTPAIAQDRGGRGGDRGGGNLAGAGTNTGGNVSRSIMSPEDEVKEMTDLASAKADLQRSRLTERQLRSRSQLRKAIARFCANDLNANYDICHNPPQLK